VAASGAAAAKNEAPWSTVKLDPSARAWGFVTCSVPAVTTVPPPLLA
jgi:hypothetical protein